MTFFNIVQNKSVAVVGNASSIHHLNKGADIDSHDIVIRMNIPGNMFYADEFSNAYGTKTDIWCFWNINAFLEAHESQYDRLYKSYFENDNIHKVQIQTATGSFTDAKDFEILYDEAKLKKLEDKMKMIYPVRLRRQNFKFSTGFLLLNYLYECNTKSVSIYGMDFKRTPTYYDPETQKYMKYGIDTRCGHDYVIESNYINNHLLRKAKKFRIR
jgi:hypothetical protein